MELVGTIIQLVFVVGLSAEEMLELNLYKQCPDKAWSHADCFSFRIM